MNFKIETVFDANVMFEFNLVIFGYTYLIIYGKHINGGFCCVPNWNWGCEMSAPDNINYNCEKLVSAGATHEVAKEIAKAISFMASDNKQ